jgi:hypothetical protein
MEYILGSIITALTFLFFIKKEKGSAYKDKPIKLGVSQSSMFNLTKTSMLISMYLNKKPLVSQASKHYDSLYVKVLFMDSKAYWIKDNTFFVADMENDEVDGETTRPVDIMAMDKVELDKMMFIVDTLTEGKKDDSSDPGHSWLQ